MSRVKQQNFLFGILFLLENIIFLVNETIAGDNKADQTVLTQITADFTHDFYWTQAISPTGVQHHQIMFDTQSMENFKVYFKFSRRSWVRRKRQILFAGRGESVNSENPVLGHFRTELIFVGSEHGRVKKPRISGIGKFPGLFDAFKRLLRFCSKNTRKPTPQPTNQAKIAASSSKGTSKIGLPQWLRWSRREKPLDTKTPDEPSLEMIIQHQNSYYWTLKFSGQHCSWLRRVIHVGLIKKGQGGTRIDRKKIELNFSEQDQNQFLFSNGMEEEDKHLNVVQTKYEYRN